MKKQIFTLAMLIFLSSAYSQQSLKRLISGEEGVSNHFTRLEPKDQVPFSPKQARDALGLDPSSNLLLQKTEKDQLGFINYRYFQTYKNIPIENSMFIAHTENGKLVGLSGEIITEFDNTIKSRSFSGLSSARAIETAIDYVHAKKYAWQNEALEKSLKEQKANAGATYYPSAKLVWFSDDENINSKNLRAAYKIDVYALVPFSSAYYFIDVQTGQVLGKKDRIFFTDTTGTANTAYSGTQIIHSDKNGSSYRLRDYTKGKGIITLDNQWLFITSDYTSPSPNWSLTGTNQAAIDAHYGVSQTYSFYKASFNRNSYDNNGAVLTSHVNNPLYSDNAFWDAASSTMNFCKSSTNTAGVTAIDITGHELTHAVTQETSGLIYSKEPGAINESMSDIMGKSVQFWSKPSDISWVLSNDMNWIIRNMANPNEQRQPDTYEGTYWVSTSDDNYGVHTNSGVGNFMFYLLVSGGSGTNDLGNSYSVKGIGLQKADQIIYRTNTTYLSPNSQYADWRVACINAAKDLYRGDTSLLASVINAWYAVGLGKPAGDASCDTPTGLSVTGITDTSVNLSWAPSDALSYSLRWKPTSSTAWTTVSVIKDTSYNLGSLTAKTAYQFQVRGSCMASKSAYSKSKNFTTVNKINTANYCTSTGTLTLLDYIDKVTLKNIANQSGSNGGYGNYTNLTAKLTKGAVNKIKLTPGFSLFTLNEYWAVFIDYNQDGDFTDSLERVVTGSGMSDITKSFTIPSTAKTGATRLRIQMTSTGPASNNPCADFLYGEVEDYTVKIQEASATTSTPSSFNIVKESMGTGIKVSPNPVAGSAATVSYTMTKSSRVTLIVMDFSGRIVQTITPGNKTSGTYTASLDNTQKLSAGTYIIALLQDNKMIAKTSFIITK